MISQLRSQFKHWLWDERVLTPLWFPVRWMAQLLAAILVDLKKAEINLRAMSLVYTTILSLVPMLAFSFSLLKAFGVHDRMAPVLEHFLEPIGAQASVLTAQILGFVNNLDVRLLGFVGLVLLLYTMLRLMYKVQKSLDHAWGVVDSPNLGKRIADYLTMGLLGPLLLLSLGTAAAGFDESVRTAELMQIGAVSSLYAWLLSSLPFVMIAIGLTFIYWFMPNCQVQLSAAAISGVVAAFFWKGSGVLFTNFIAGSAQYNIYAGFASAMLFFIWLYLSWLIFLYGARLAFYLQYPEQMRPEARQIVRGGRALENAGLSVLAKIAANHYLQLPPQSMEQLSRSLKLSRQTLQPLLHAFEQDGLIARNNADTPAYIPAVPMEDAPLARALHVIRRLDAETVLPITPEVEAFSAQLDGVIEQNFGDIPLKALIKDVKNAD